MNLVGLTNIKYELNHLKSIPHTLFFGGRGTGKTTLSQYIADLKGKRLTFLTGNTLRLNELLKVFVDVEDGDIILIDEIHGLSPRIEEVLYQPMETGKLYIKDVSGTFQEYQLPKFTLIGTTTKPSMISKPLMSRFQLMFQIPHYNIRELARIIRVNFNKIAIPDALKIAINVVSPREAVNLARRVSSLGDNIIKNLEFVGYKYGLSKAERFYLKIVNQVGKISLTNLASALQLDGDEVRYIEEKLIRKGYINVSSSGRSLTVKGLIKIKELKR